MSQSRNIIGVQFENTICESKGWKKVTKSPKIKWAGQGPCNFSKILSVNFDINKFKPMSDSTFEKYDAVSQNGDKIEIKKYKKSKVKNWTMYSEPMFKVSTKQDLIKLVDLYGQGSLDLAKTKYNDFVYNMFNNIDNDIINKITKTNIGVQFEDGFLPHSKLEYRWEVCSGWRGFKRLSIMFKVRD